MKTAVQAVQVWIGVNDHESRANKGLNNVPVTSCTQHTAIISLELLPTLA